MPDLSRNGFIQLGALVKNHKIMVSSIVASTAGYYTFLNVLEQKGIIRALCPIKNLTGFPCPGCGMTRACLCLIRLDWAGAFYYHPLSFLLVASMGYVCFNEIRELLTGKKWSYQWVRKSKKIWIPLLALMIIVNWIWSLSKGI